MSDGAGIGIFAIFFLFIVVIALAPFIFAIVSIVSILTTPEPAFGPWWDNTRTMWLIGVLVSFAIPLGGLITGVMWISTGRKGIKEFGVAGRPFWAGSPKPPPYYPGPGPYPGPGQGPYPGPGMGPYPGPPQGPTTPPSY